MKRNTGQLVLVYDPATQAAPRRRPPSPPPIRFDGETYDHELDHGRLSDRLWRTLELMRDGRWHTLEEIQEHTGGNLCSVSARVRDLRKRKFGGHTVHRRRQPHGPPGMWEYRLVI